jgi:hypothetical protein
VAKFGVLHLNAGDGNDLIAISGARRRKVGDVCAGVPGQNPFELLGVGPLGGTTFRGSGEDEIAKAFDAFLHYDPFTNSTSVVAKTGDKATGAKPGRVFSTFDRPGGDRRRAGHFFFGLPEGRGWGDHLQ